MNMLRKLSLSVILMLAVFGVMAVRPSAAAAAPAVHARGTVDGGVLVFQPGGGDNPFTDAGAQQSALDMINNMVFWVWITCAGGLMLWTMAYFLQPLVPSWYNQIRDYVRNGRIIGLFFGMVLNFILSRATAAQGGSGFSPADFALAVAYLF